jgi:hypothetical protein
LCRELLGTAFACSVGSGVEVLTNLLSSKPDSKNETNFFNAPITESLCDLIRLSHPQ